jgi:hypothetical protein
VTFQVSQLPAAYEPRERTYAPRVGAFFHVTRDSRHEDELA